MKFNGFNLKAIQNTTDALPDEGALPDINCNISYVAELSKRQMNFKKSEIDRIINSFFEGKAPPAKKNQKAKILLGGPGAGKTCNAIAQYDALCETEKDHTIFVSYDERGAIFALPDYIEDLKTALGVDEIDPLKPIDEKFTPILTELWDDYRPVSQYIRSQILKRSVREGYSMHIDTTSSSPGTLKMLDTLFTSGVTQIDVDGSFAPFGISIARLRTRLRPASMKEAVTKRLGAISMVRDMLDYTNGHFRYFYNPDNQNTPKLAFEMRGQELTASPKIISEIIENLQSEKQDIEQHIKTYNLGSALMKEVEKTYAEFENYIRSNILGQPTKPDATLKLKI